MNKKLKVAVSHHDREVEELRGDRELAVEYAPYFHLHSPLCKRGARGDLFCC